MNNLVGFFRKSMNTLENGGFTLKREEKILCPSCKRENSPKILKKENMICPCGYHFRLKARDRAEMIFGEWEELFPNTKRYDPLTFPGYAEKLQAAEKSSGEKEAVICGRGKIDECPCAFFIMEPSFMMGSMGQTVGTKITALFEYATERKLPMIGFTASGGARMQEGILSLMQMAKVSGAVKRHSEKSLLYVTVLTDPTTGGVTASFAMQGDIILSEPGALVGFAGKRVIEQTTGELLPDSFQKAEFVMKHGFIDAIVPRKELKSTLHKILLIHTRPSIRKKQG